MDNCQRFVLYEMQPWVLSQCHNAALCAAVTVSVIIRPFTQRFTVAIICTDDMFPLKITRIFIWYVPFTVFVLTCFVMCVCVCVCVCVEFVMCECVYVWVL